MGVIVDKKRINEVFDRGVIVQVLPAKKELLDRMLSGERLRIYIGADPTSDSLHLSHFKNYVLLEEFRQLGHEVIVLVGDFTAQIGDPTDRTAARKQLSEEEINNNVKNWVSQIKPILDFDDKKNPPRILYNSEWLAKLSFKDVVLLASQFTVQQMMERDMFEKRLANNIPIHLHEFLYPVMQGYDSVAMDVDIELCGTDQTFNALAGRTLLKRLKNKEKFVVVVNLMENPKTHELMSKSKGTGVFLSSPPNDLFGSIMAQPDEMTEIFFINCTRIPLSEKKQILGLGPRDAKMRVAFEIVKQLHGEHAAREAQENFETIFSRHEIPADAPELAIASKPISVLDLVMTAGVMKSKSEARRLIEQGGFECNGEVYREVQTMLNPRGGETVRIGKKYFFRIARKER